MRTTRLLADSQVPHGFAGLDGSIRRGGAPWTSSPTRPARRIPAPPRRAPVRRHRSAAEPAVASSPRGVVAPRRLAAGTRRWRVRRRGRRAPVSRSAASTTTRAEPGRPPGSGFAGSSSARAATRSAVRRSPDRPAGRRAVRLLVQRNAGHRQPAHRAGPDRRDAEVPGRQGRRHRHGPHQHAARSSPTTTSSRAPPRCGSP